jgi:hypothetical protein
MDYKASLKEWMGKHLLSTLDVRDLLREIKLDNDSKPRPVKTAEDREFEEAYRQHEERTHR